MLAFHGIQEDGRRGAALYIAQSKDAWSEQDTMSNARAMSMSDVVSTAPGRCLTSLPS